MRGGGGWERGRREECSVEEMRGTEGVDEDAGDELERRLLPQAHGPSRRAVQQLQRP